jgi:hypothetical protein
MHLLHLLHVASSDVIVWHIFEAPVFSTVSLRNDIRAMYIDVISQACGKCKTHVKLPAQRNALT